MFVQQYMFNNMRLTILDQTSLIDMPAKEGGLKVFQDTKATSLT